MSFWTSYNLELDFDYLVVEAHTVGQDDWTTLPDQNGHTTSDLSADESCPGGWSNPDDAANLLHPFLTHYQNVPGRRHLHADRDDRPVECGERQLKRVAGPVAVRRQAGRGLDHRAQRLGLPALPGVFIEDIAVSTGEGRTSFEDDGDAMDGWKVPCAPQDPDRIEEPNRNDWVRRGGLGIKEGAVVKSPDTLYMGFGFEGIPGPRPGTT